MSLGTLRYNLFRFFHGDRRPDTLAGQVKEFVTFSSITTMQDIVDHFASYGNERSVRSTVYLLEKSGVLKRVGKVETPTWVPVVPVSIFSYRFIVRVASVVIPAVYIIYSLKTGVDPVTFTFAFAMLTLGAGSLVEMAEGA